MSALAQILGENIARERTARGLTQAALGEAVGVQGLTVYRWETGKTWPTAQNIEDIAGVFGATPWSLYAPQGTEKVLAKPRGPDPKLRDAVATICRALGFSLAVPKGRPKR